MHFSKVADPISFPSPGIFREGHEYGSVLEYSSWSTREGHRVQQPSSILEAQACQTVKAVIASGSDKSIGFACGTDAGVQRVCHYSSTLVWGLVRSTYWLNARRCVQCMPWIASESLTVHQIFDSVILSFLSQLEICPDHFKYEISNRCRM